MHVVGGKGEVEARGKDHWPGGGEQVEGALRAGAMGGREEGEDQSSGSYGERYWLDICLHIAALLYSYGKLTLPLSQISHLT